MKKYFITIVVIMMLALSTSGWTMDISNPAHPASPLNLANPANPLSPMNPLNLDQDPIGTDLPSSESPAPGIWIFLAIVIGILALWKYIWWITR